MEQAVLKNCFPFTRFATMLSPAVYLYEERDGKFQIYLGEYTTLNGLCLFDSDAAVRIENLSIDGAANSELDVVRLATVQDIKRMLSNCLAMSIVDARRWRLI